jgi:hypothetical protein
MPRLTIKNIRKGEEGGLGHFPSPDCRCEI